MLPDCRGAGNRAVREQRRVRGGGMDGSPRIVGDAAGLGVNAGM